jgi:hypothetical protein
MAGESPYKPSPIPLYVQDELAFPRRQASKTGRVPYIGCLALGSFSCMNVVRFLRVTSSSGIGH